MLHNPNSKVTFLFYCFLKLVASEIQSYTVMFFLKEFLFHFFLEINSISFSKIVFKIFYFYTN